MTEVQKKLGILNRKLNVAVVTLKVSVNDLLSYLRFLKGH